MSVIRCYLVDTRHGLVFDAHAVRTLREQHRIIGCLTGTLAEFPRQNNELGVPLALSIEECSLLANQRVISMCEIVGSIDDGADDQQAYLAELDGEFQRQLIDNGHERINEILLKRESILQKAMASSSNELDLDNEPLLRTLLESNHAWQNCRRALDDAERRSLISIIKQRVTQFTFEHMFVKIPMASKRTNLQLRSITGEELRAALPPIDQLRCDVFADLYLNQTKKYWISNGQKFGGDFLVYFDDPSQCHSTFIVTCVLRHELQTERTIVPLTHLIARCRVAVNVNKISVLASRKSPAASDIEYLSMNWNGF